MSSKSLKTILDATFRANPHYELVLFDRLPPEQQEVLKDLKKDADFYGILLPQESSKLTIKSVCQDTDLLYYSLQTPGRLPIYLQSKLGEQSNQAIAQLVLDGVLEIESEDGFVAGLEAYKLIYAEKLPPKAQTALARLSLEALKYAQALDIKESQQLSTRLYCYNRLPLSPRWQRRFPTSDAVAEYLGIQGGSHQLSLERDWLRLAPPPDNDGWFAWTSRHTQAAPQSQKFIYKLYVSPQPELMRDVFPLTVAVLSQLSAPHFKVGKDIAGLLRPDKLMAYFWHFEDLQAVVNQLQTQLSGITPHGVPFTAELGGDGLLSWGIDPPQEEQSLSWLGRESWRLWVTNHLATALLAAKSAQSKTVEPWQFALERLQLEGIDTETWIPQENLWNRDFQMEA